MQSFETLVIQSQAHDRPLEERQDAFGKLAIRFQDMAFSQAFERLGDLDLAQDVAQESFLTAYKNLDQLQHPLAFPSWLRRIVLTHCNRITRRKQHPIDPIDNFEHLTDDRYCPAAETEQRDLWEKILTAIRELPEHQRVVTELFYLDGYSQHDISKRIHIPVKTVKSRLYSSRQRLQERLHKLLTEEKEGEIRTQYQVSERVQIAPTHQTIQNRQSQTNAPSASCAWGNVWASRNLLDTLLECERLRIHICLQPLGQDYHPIEVPLYQTGSMSELQSPQIGLPLTTLPCC
ncbi:MAG: sigma-70 family RNA polymerase sigma factor [bacterium]|nr:sigma-70 family RNA polymerase sigma factor [bacterium]